MDKDEYWVLDTVVESWDSLAMLAFEDVGTAFNKPDHGLNRYELLNVLERLFRRGDLLAKRKEKHITEELFIPTRTEIEAAFDRRMKVFYGLTFQGGARWEEVSCPRWERYICAWQSLDPNEGEIIGSDLRLVKEFDSMTPRLGDISVVSGSKRWDVLKPWQATYWKSLPKGHRVRYRYELQAPPPKFKPDPAIDKWLREINNWYTPYTGSLA